MRYLHPEISYILCVHNGEKTLKNSLESLLNQRTVDLEIIAVNDGSTDYSLKILKKYRQKDNRLRVFSQRQMGLAASRNFGIKKANGNYIASASQDDIYLPDKSCDQLNFMKENNLDFSFTAIDIIDTSGKIREHPLKRHYNEKLWSYPQVILQTTLFMPLCSPTFMCKKECYQKIIWNPGICSFADKNLWIKFFRCYHGSKLDKISLLRRLKSEESTKQLKHQYPLSFLYLEHRAAVAASFLFNLFPAWLILPINDLTKLTKYFMMLEKETNKKEIFEKIYRIYKRRNYTFLYNRLRNLTENYLI